VAIPPEAAAPDLQALHDALRQRLKRLHRRVLEPDVLRGLLPIRARAVRHASLQPDAREREQRFRAASPAYVAVLDDPAAFAVDTRVMTLDSLTWWVPLTAPDNPALVARAMKHQDFPYRAITQTREVSLGGVMIDIGANTGRMSVPRVILGDAMVAYCAEPDPLNHACLVRNVRDNHLTGLVLPDHLAIGATDATIRLERGKSSGGHRVIDAGTSARREVLEVRSLRLDTWVDLMGIDLDLVRFVKVDVQGSELDVLRGAAGVLARKHIAWQIEVDLETLGARGVRGPELYLLMQEHFTHFVDLNRHLTTTRVRPVAEIPDALAYVSGGTGGRTDVVLFTLEQPHGT
jgi:FkbM family methyltransferase